MTTKVDPRRIQPRALAARSMIGAALAHVWRDPLRQPSGAQSIAPEDLAPLRQAWALTTTGCGNCRLDELSLGELTPDRASIEPLIQWLTSAPADRVAAFDAVFGLVTSKDCPPHETDYCHWEDPTYRSSQMADVGGFYRAFGVEPGGERPERPDHVSIELEFIAFLCQKHAIAIQSGDADHIAVCRDALHAFVRDHVAWWMPTFARCVQRRVDRQRESIEHPEQAELLKSLDGICDLLRAWVAIIRLDAGVPASREIIAPNAPSYHPEEEDEACASCGTALGGAPSCSAAPSLPK